MLEEEPILYQLEVILPLIDINILKIVAPQTAVRILLILEPPAMDHRQKETKSHHLIIIILGKIKVLLLQVKVPI